MSWAQRWLDWVHNLIVHIRQKGNLELFWQGSGTIQDHQKLLLQNCSAVLQTTLFLVGKPEYTQLVHCILEGLRPSD